MSTSSVSVRDLSSGSLSTQVTEQFSLSAASEPAETTKTKGPVKPAPAKPSSVAYGPQPAATSSAPNLTQTVQQKPAEKKPAPKPLVTFEPQIKAAVTGDVTSTSVGGNIVVPLAITGLDPKTTFGASSLRLSYEKRTNEGTAPSVNGKPGAPVDSSVNGYGVTVNVPLGPKTTAYAFVGHENTTNNLTGAQSIFATQRIGIIQRGNIGNVKTSINLSAGVADSGPVDKEKQKTFRPRADLRASFPIASPSTVKDPQVTLNVGGLLEGRMSRNDFTEAALEKNGGRLLAAARAEVRVAEPFKIKNSSFTIGYQQTFAGSKTGTDYLGAAGGFGGAKGSGSLVTTFGWSFK